MEKKKQAIVIKIGSSVLMTKRNKLDEFRLTHIADQLIRLHQNGVNVVLVVSGAVACGVDHLTNDFTYHTNKRGHLYLCGKDLLRQAAAGIGQAKLMSALVQIFEQKKLKLAQILLTRDDIKSAHIRNNLAKTLSLYIESGIIPVFNENDVLDLNSFGGNDFLAAEIAKLINVDQLLILSTFGGSIYGVGGGRTKVEVSSLLKERNIKTLIVNGKGENIILESLL